MAVHRPCRLLSDYHNNKSLNCPSLASPLMTSYQRVTTNQMLMYTFCSKIILLYCTVCVPALTKQRKNKPKILISNILALKKGFFAKHPFMVIPAIVLLFTLFFHPFLPIRELAKPIIRKPSVFIFYYIIFYKFNKVYASLDQKT